MNSKLNRENEQRNQTRTEQPVPLTALSKFDAVRHHSSSGYHDQNLHRFDSNEPKLQQQPSHKAMPHAHKTRTGDERTERSKLHRNGAAGRTAVAATTTATTTNVTPTQPQTSSEIYIVNNNNNDGNNNNSNPATMERAQKQRSSWINMRRNVDPILAESSATATGAGYLSASTAADGGVAGGGSSGGGGGSTSGRTTSASGRISTSGINTISGSNNTLNDIISDYHNPEVIACNDYHHRCNTTSPSPQQKLSSNDSFNVGNGSTVKLLPAADDERNQQTKCSVFRGLMLCLCLNVTYTNIVRFPRELDKYGSAYLIPYITLLLLVGLPIILLEISLGQFLGQGAAHTWRASPIFKGACIVSRFASWLSTVWISLQAVLALAYIVMLSLKSVPFTECIGDIKLAENGYQVIGNSGQECLQKTFLTPLWENPLYFGLLSIGLIGIWIVVMLCTHNGRILRRSLFFFGFIGFALLCIIASLEVHNSLERTYFPDLWPFDGMWLLYSNIWYSALMQVLFATSCGFGILPMITGKFLYKGDAVRTSIVYLCFKLLINALAVTLFMIQFDVSANSSNLLEELKPLTAIYDRLLNDDTTTRSPLLAAHLIPILIYTLMLISALVSLTVGIYTATRLVPRHPNYVVSLCGLVVSVVSLAAPKFSIARLLDTRLVGTLVITALVFELIAITWIYGAKNIYTDLEFSIGRPILQSWMALWCFCPVLLTGVLVWWCADDDQFDLLADYVPRWAPILFVLAIVLFIAGILIFRQVEYNFFGMICEAAKSAKEWGPADPLARHAWKQWRSVCQDTGQRDFTLRRRGTRDYTQSIKRGQYSNAHKYSNGQASAAVTTGAMSASASASAAASSVTADHQSNWKSSTPGNSSPNYSGSMFGDSAIEEDISVDKFPGITQSQFVPFQNNDSKRLRYSHRVLHAQQRIPPPPQHHTHSNPPHSHPHPHPHSHSHSHPHHPQQQQQQNSFESMAAGKHREVVYIRRLSDEGQHATRIEITPSNESITYGVGAGGSGGGSGAVRNPLAQTKPSAAYLKRSHSALQPATSMRGQSAGMLPPPLLNGHAGSNAEHICWRKFSANADEYSTEL